MPGKYFDRKQDRGFKGWLHEDLIYLVTAFRQDIQDLSPPGSEYRHRMNEAEQKHRDGRLDEKGLMHELEGIVRRLRDAWENGQV